jgi:2-polyprenyl-3-methyl-5-hydroxy-6-metoxy-1,4-benzoquinol methylase
MLSRRQLARQWRPTLSAWSPRQLARRLRYPVPAALRKRHVTIDAHGINALARSLAANYHKGWRGRDRMSKEAYRADRAAHMTGRLESDRRIVIPWLNATRPLDGLRVLDVGCGTGSSTVALTEQGAIVTAIDIDADALIVAKERCRIYGKSADLHRCNAIEAAQVLPAPQFDLITLFACVEHMTMPERLASLPALWGLLKPGGMLAIMETPNRLWFHDHHTSDLPFFNWLPDDLAYASAKFSQREDLRSTCAGELSAYSTTQFLRLGRGASYHEFDATIGPAKVISSLSTSYGWRHTLRRTWRERRYKALIRSVRPELHDGWFEPWLDIIIAK